MVYSSRWLEFLGWCYGLWTWVLFLQMSRALSACIFSICHTQKGDKLYSLMNRNKKQRWEIIILSLVAKMQLGKNTVIGNLLCNYIRVTQAQDSYNECTTCNPNMHTHFQCPRVVPCNSCGSFLLALTLTQQHSSSPTSPHDRDNTSLSFCPLNFVLSFFDRQTVNDSQCHCSTQTGTMHPVITLPFVHRVLEWLIDCLLMDLDHLIL